MNSMLWLLAYELIFVSATLFSVWLAKGIKKELSGFGYSTVTALRLMSKTTALILSATLVMYSSSVLTYVSTR